MECERYLTLNIRVYQQAVEFPEFETRENFVSVAEVENRNN
jgi:hypothetical protein